MPESTLILNAAAIQRALTRIAHEIAERNEAGSEVVLVGIQRGGVPLAQRLGALLTGIWGQPVPTGSLDVSMHRDDLDQRVAPNVQPTVIPFDVTGKTVVLVDDVLFSGRTIRAAMDALNDFGRPRRIQLAVLIDRGHRELPIKADFVGKNVPTARTERVRVRLTEMGGADEVRDSRNDPNLPTMSWNRKHLLDIESLTAEEIITVLDTARAFKAVGERAIKKVPALRGKTVVNLFVEPSTRTRTSFELSEQRLSADIINFTAEASSLKKGETLKDTARNLEALNADFIVIRHSASGAPHFLSRVLNASVINAGDGAHEHPTQALLDTFTIREKKGRIAGLNVTILGDILYSRVARSDIWALTKLGAKVTLCGPSTLVPRVFEQMGCRVTHDVEEAIRDADIINLLRIQHERQRKTMFPSLGEYTSLFGLNKARLARTKPDALIMHPGPINRGVEIDSEIADCGRSVILEQVTNGLAVRMAVLFLVNGGKGPQEVAP